MRGFKSDRSQSRATNRWGRIVERLLVGLGGGMGLKDLVGFSSREFGLAGEKVEVHAFLVEIGSVRELLETGFDFFLGLLNFALLDELMSLLGQTLLRP